MCTFEFCFICLDQWKGYRCYNGCELFERNTLEIMVNDQVQADRRVGLNVDVDRIREEIRNRRECTHRSCTQKFLMRRKKNCINCDYNLYLYSYQCDDCEPTVHVCNTCYLYRMR